MTNDETRDGLGLHHEELVPLDRARSAVASHAAGGRKAYAYDATGNTLSGTGARASSSKRTAW